MPACLFTMRDLAAAWQVPLSTAYQYVAEVVHDFPDVEWYRQGRRGRRFTRAQADRVTEAIWGSATTCTTSATPPEPPGRATAPTTGGPRSIRRRETARLRDELLDRSPSESASAIPRAASRRSFPRS